MKAIFVTGGKQYYVSEGETIFVEKQGKQKKITVFKYKPKKKYRKKQGHRQPYTKLTMKSINVK